VRCAASRWAGPVSGALATVGDVSELRGLLARADLPPQAIWGHWRMYLSMLWLVAISFHSASTA
jgi:hypothetical protein